MKKIVPAMYYCDVVRSTRMYKKELQWLRSKKNRNYRETTTKDHLVFIEKVHCCTGSCNLNSNILER